MKRKVFGHSLTLLLLLLIQSVLAQMPPLPMTVVLDENPTTGYAWRYMANAEGILNEVSNNYEQDADIEGKAGTGGKRIWVFEGIAPGDVLLYFAYSRPFEETAAPKRKVAFAISVNEALLVTLRGKAEINGSQVLVTLPENPTTGYARVVNPDPYNILTVLGDTYLPDDVPQGVVGAGGMRTWQFNAVAPGEVILRFTHERSWETESIDSISFAFSIDENLIIEMTSSK